MRILALIGDRPFPPVTGIAVRNLHLWSCLARLEGVDLRVLSLDLSGPSASEPPCFPGVEAEFFRFGSRPLWTRASGVLTRSWHEYPQSPDLALRVDDLASSFRPDVIHAEELRMSAYLPPMRGQPTPALPPSPSTTSKATCSPGPSVPMSPPLSEPSLPGSRSAP